MSSETPVATREKTRIFVTGSCDGLDQLREALERHGEIELVGTSVAVTESAGVPTGGHLQVILHGTGSPTLPPDHIPTFRRPTRPRRPGLAGGRSDRHAWSTTARSPCHPPA